MMEIAQDLVAILAPVGALIIGAIGLTTWRRQLKGGSKHDIAKNLLMATYRLRDTIQAARDPVMLFDASRVEGAGQIIEEQRNYDRRMRGVYESLSNLRAIELEAKAIGGDWVEGVLQPLKEQVGELRGAIWLHFWMKGAYAGPEETVDNSLERRRQNDRIVYRGQGDDFTQRLDGIVKNGLC